MQRVWTGGVLAAMLAAAGIIAGQFVRGADGPASPVFTNKSRFRIPFRYDAAEMERLQAREVQLFLSTDQGTHWRVVDKTDPRGDHFDFLSTGDGEYWFAVRTLDAFNQLHPQGKNIEPGLKVIVDATPPALELTLTEIEPGKVELRWTAADDHLDVTRLRLEYRQADSTDWLPVGVVPQPSGQSVWAVPAGGVVSVRGSIGDAAGNSATAERELNVRASAQSGPKKSQMEYRGPVAGSAQPNLTVREPIGREPVGDVFSDPDPPTAKKLESTAPPAAPTAKTEGDLFDDHFDSGLRIQPKAKDALVADSPSTRPAIVQKPKTQLQSPHAQQPQAADPTVPDEFGPPERPSSPADTAAPKAGDDAGPRTIMVNNRDFQIGYRVDDVGTSGVGKVELFITQDGGRKWYRYGTDPDNQSPFSVSVPADGVYGFELRVKNGAGIGDDPPRPGDKPSIVVTVDKTPPIAQLLAPQIGRGRSRNKVLVRWTADDAHLGAAPVLLEYAAQASGPWEKIGDWQANSGRYVWAITPGLPGKVILRLTVKDEANNVTQVVAPDPLVIDFVRPTARIVDVEAKAASAPRN